MIPGSLPERQEFVSWNAGGIGDFFRAFAGIVEKERHIKIIRAVFVEILPAVALTDQGDIFISLPDDGYQELTDDSWSEDGYARMSLLGLGDVATPVK